MKVIEAKKSEKREHLLRLLERGTVMVILDARHRGVAVPPDHADNPRLPLNLDYAFQIPDFRVIGDRVEVSLSFNKKDFFCVLPFDAIYLMISQFAGETVLFKEDVPADILDHLPQQPLVEGVALENELGQDKPPEERPKKRDRSHLRVVK